MNHNHIIKHHLQKFGCINQLQAMQEYGCLRLSARIYDLRQKGLDILTIREKGSKNYANYYYMGELL